jgi:hypothetical protein
MTSFIDLTPCYETVGAFQPFVLETCSATFAGEGAEGPGLAFGFQARIGEQHAFNFFETGQANPNQLEAITEKGFHATFDGEST